MCLWLHALSSLSFLHLVLCCTFNPEDARAICSSFSSLEKQGPQSEWKKLNVANPGGQEFGPVPSRAFEGYSNLVDLQVKGLANDIQPDAWKGLHRLYELHLDDNKLHVIKKNMFQNLPISVLYIYFCEVQELEAKSMNKMPNLKWVFMFGNNITTIEADVFTGTDITHLIMRKNNIRYVKPNAFGNMDNLVHLSLEENALTSFAPQLTIGFASKLTHLYINRNKISKVTREMFSVMPNLQILLININQIERFGDNVFSDLRKLYLLDMSNNRLEELQANIFNSRGMKELQFFFLHDNKLSFLSSGVLIRLPNLKKITVGGNPWQCPCWDTLDYYLIHQNITKLCDDVYKFGKRPSCVYSEKAPKDCIYDIENVRDVPQIYEEQIKEYTQLPPVCNIDGVDKPVLGAK